MKIIENVFGYLYYKYSRPYKKHEGRYYYITPIILLSMCQTFNVLSILPFIIKCNMNNWIYYIVGMIFLLSNTNYFLSKNKRTKYELRWGKEKYAKKRLGTAIAIAYVTVSFILFFWTMQYYLEYTGWEQNLNCSWAW